MKTQRTTEGLDLHNARFHPIVASVAMHAFCAPCSDTSRVNAKQVHIFKHPIEVQDQRASVAALPNCTDSRTSRENREPEYPDPNRSHARLKRSTRRPQKATEDPRYESMKIASEAPRPWKFLKDTDATRIEKSIMDKDAANLMC